MMITIQSKQSLQLIVPSLARQKKILLKGYFLDVAEMIVISWSRTQKIEQAIVTVLYFD